MTSKTQVLTWIGFSTAARRNTIIADLMPDNGNEGLDDLLELDKSSISDACDKYKSLTVGSFTVSSIQASRLTSLVYFIKDCQRIGETCQVPPDIE